ncbi:hypothetical protein [Sorangium cellulosum]|uniref:hypothetical protein n=1 Tax=Sorangium cellulosum TaxID=56 RepID=UPI001A9362D5|nr:hypothetical protein [Sorangium cellulosum]
MDRHGRGRPPGSPRAWPEAARRFFLGDLTNPLLFMAVSNEKLNMKAGRQEDFPVILLPLFPPSCEFPEKFGRMHQLGDR